MGHPKAFTVEEASILRAALTEAKAKHDWSDQYIADQIGVVQQNVSRFLRGGGPSRQSAKGIARLLNYHDADELIAEHIAMAGIKGGTRGGNVWHARDSAVRVAEAMGYAAAAIQAIVERHATPDDARQPAKWWLSRIALEEQFQESSGRKSG